MATLDTVAKYVTDARVLLQDTVPPYRYADTELVEGLNLAVLEARRLRPDLFLGSFGSLPSFSAADSTAVPVDEQYRVAFLYYVCGHAQLRDEETTQDARASAFFKKFLSSLVALG